MFLAILDCFKVEFGTNKDPVGDPHGVLFLERLMKTKISSQRGQYYELVVVENVPADPENVKIHNPYRQLSEMALAAKIQASLASKA